MTDDPDDPSLIALGAAVSDGAAVDWGEVEGLADGDDRQRLVRAMRDVETLVAAHRQVEALATNDTPAASARHWQHLVLFEPVGEGAFGTVYRGWDPRLEREVAVKLLRKSPHNLHSPLTEARHLARVRHSNIVVVHGADQDDEQVGIWMEYIEGQTLAAMVRVAGPMSAREATGIGIDLCRALAALHAAGLLHRDIKAHNVMRELGGRIVLMDFSGAQALTSEHDAEVFSGTPLYMSPELLEGAAATAASDVYSLGVLLFFLLTGTVPVEGSSIAALRSAHGRGARKRLRDLRSDVPQAIVQVIECATEPDPAKRYQTVGDLEHALAAVSGAPVALAPAEPVQSRVAAATAGRQSRAHRTHDALGGCRRAAGGCPRRGRHALPSVGGSRHRAIYRRTALHHRKLAAPVARWAADRVRDRRRGPQPALDQAARFVGRPAVDEHYRDRDAVLVAR